MLAGTRPAHGEPALWFSSVDASNGSAANCARDGSSVAPSTMPLSPVSDSGAFSSCVAASSTRWDLYSLNVTRETQCPHSAMSRECQE
jgi:hypothetical protein